MGEGEGGRSVAQASEEILEIGGRWRFEIQHPAVGGVRAAQSIRMERLSLECDRANRLRSVGVALFPHERMTAQAGLDADLVSSSRLKPHLDQRRVAK